MTVLGYNNIRLSLFFFSLTIQSGIVLRYINIRLSLFCFSLIIQSGIVLGKNYIRLSPSCLVINNAIYNFIQSTNPVWDSHWEQLHPTTICRHSSSLESNKLLFSLDVHNHVDDYSGTLGGVRKVHISALVASS